MEKPRRPCSLFKRPTVKQHTFVYYVSQFGSAFGLSLETGRAQLFKGILEGIAYELKVNIASFQRARIPVRALRAIGGGSRSDTWMQLKADILGIPVEPPLPKQAASGRPFSPDSEPGATPSPHATCPRRRKQAGHSCTP